jgi:uncharacterized membrane protein YkoI
MGTMARGICALLILTFATAGHAQERKLAKKDLPAAVMAAFQRVYPNATIKAVAEEKKDGKVCYEVESLDGGTSRDLLYLVDGTVVEIEEAIPVAELPQVVMAAVAAKYPKAKVLKAEKVTKGAVVTYDVEVRTGGRKVAVDVDASGRVIK